MKQPIYIYVHGFNSSPESMKAQLFLRFMQENGWGDLVLVPELSHWPKLAMGQLTSLVKKHSEQPVVLLGSSLGGFYSTWLTEHYSHVRSVLINPSVKPFELLPQYLGMNENIYNGERYELTELHLSQLLAIHCEEIAKPDAYLLLTQTADETLDYREAVDKFSASPQFVQPGGSHGFEQFENMIPAILAFGQGRIELPDAQPI